MELSGKNYKLLSRNEAAEYLGLKPNTLATWKNKKILPYVKLGRHCKYLLSDLEAFIESKRGGDR